MLPLNQADIDRLHAGGHLCKSAWLEPLERADGTWYQLCLMIGEVAEPWLLYTARGEPRLFRQPDAALRFLEDQFPELPELVVKMKLSWGGRSDA